MEKTIITIARQYGSGGRTVGKMLAERLNIPYYDREIIELASEDSGINAVIFQDEKKKPSLRALLHGYTGSGTISPESAGFTRDDNLFNYQAKIIRQLADEGSCVLIGRCADYILRDRTDCLKVFIHADMKFRADRIVRVYGEREESPETRLKEKDKRRAAYYRFYTAMKWGNAANYHIALDSGVIGIEKCAEIIESLV